MKKSSPTTKELSKMRIAKHKFMKIPNNEGKFANMENVNPQVKKPAKNNVKGSIARNRDVKDISIYNPFDIPNYKRVFSKSQGPMKVKSEPFIMNEPHTIGDFYSLFYKEIEGRPLRQFTDVKVYMRNIRDITLFRANAAYLKDRIIQIDTKYTFEKEEYNKIIKLYEQSTRNFVQFAKESYERAKQVQEKAEEKYIEMTNMSEQLECISFKYVKVRNQLSNIISSFETLVRYRTFLNDLSPTKWREDIEIVSFTNSSIHPQETRNDTSKSVASIDEYKANCIAKIKQLPPYLYFEKPKQLMVVFDDLRRQCLNYMQIDNLTSTARNTVQKKRNDMKAKVETEISEFKEITLMYEHELQFYEDKEIAYKKLFERVLLSEFQRLYASYDSCKLFTCVQYVSTQIFGDPEDPKDSVVTLMHDLEMLYTKLTSGLDNLNQDVVKASTKEFFAQDINAMNRAHKAQRVMKECDILKNALYASFKPPRYRRVTK